MNSPRVMHSLLALAISAVALNAVGAPLEVAVSGVRKSTGQLLVKIVDSAAAYDGQGKAVAADRVVPEGDTAAFRFDLPAGRYSVMVMHDENGDGQLGRNVIGIPTEAYGFSNNPRVMRRPTFEETAFELAADGGSIQIELN